MMEVNCHNCKYLRKFYHRTWPFKAKVISHGCGWYDNKYDHLRGRYCRESKGTIPLLNYAKVGFYNEPCRIHEHGPSKDIHEWG